MCQQDKGKDEKICKRSNDYQYIIEIKWAFYYETYYKRFKFCFIKILGMLIQQKENGKVPSLADQCAVTALVVQDYLGGDLIRQALIQMGVVIIGIDYLMEMRLI